MRMNTRRAAIKEYLRAATRMAKEMNKSCQRTCTLAHVRIPVRPSARTLSGSGSNSFLQLKPKRGNLWLLPSLPFSCCCFCWSLEPLGGCGCCVFPCSLKSLLLLANTRSGSDFEERDKGKGVREWEEENGKEECETGTESEGFNPINAFFITTSRSCIQFLDFGKMKRQRWKKMVEKIKIEIRWYNLLRSVVCMGLCD